MRPKIVVYIFFLCLASSMEAQQINIKTKPNIKFNSVPYELSNNYVSSIIQDSYGYLWVGTIQGLNRFNGLEFEVFESSPELSSLPHAEVYCLFEQSDSSLWVGTLDGLCLYNREKNNFIRYPMSSSHTDLNDFNLQTIISIIEDGKGTLWVSNQREGLFYKEKSSDKFVSYDPDVLGTKKLAALKFESDSILWVGTHTEGLKKLNLNTKKVTHFRPNAEDPKSITITNVEDLEIDKNGDLYISGDYGIDRLSKGATIFQHLTTRKLQHAALLYDSQDRLWACVENGGLLLYEPSKDSFYNFENGLPEPHSIPSSSYWSIYEDHENRIWIGSTLDGLTVIDNQLSKFEYYQNQPFNPKSLDCNIVRDIYEDDKENLWIATDGGGLNYFNRADKSFVHLKNDPLNPNSLGSDAVTTICQGNEGELWIGTWMGGVNILNIEKKKFKRFQPENINLNRVFALLKSSQDDIWIGSHHAGVSRYNLKTKEFITYKYDIEDRFSLGSQSVIVLFEDSKGNIWIGTQSSGLYLLRKEDIESGKFARMTSDSSELLRSFGDRVNHVIEDSKGNIWIASSGGLSLYIEANETFINYSKKDGLASDYNYAIAEDRLGFLWISTEKGISKFDPNKKTFQNYNHIDGLQSGAFSQNSILKTKRGEFIFGGLNGFTSFYPEEVKINYNQSKTYITGLKVFNEPIAIGDESTLLTKDISLLKTLTLSYKHSVFTLDYIGLNYTNPEKNSYAYMLIGLEKNWNYVGDKKSATYTNLDPGEYTFRVKSTNNDGIWNDEGASLKIIVLPAWWQTWWAKLLWTILILSTLISLYILRIKNLKNQRTKLQETVKTRTKELLKQSENLKFTNEKLILLSAFKYDLTNMIVHDLKNPLNFMINVPQSISLEKQNISMKRSAKQMLNMVLDILDVAKYSETNIALNKINRSIYGVSQVAIDEISFLAEKKNIQVESNISRQYKVEMDPGIILRVFTNLLTNAIKYTPNNGKISLSLIPPNTNSVHYSESPMFKVIVNNSGDPITINKLQGIFDKFNQLKPRMSGHIQSTGIGLAFCKIGIEAHGGQIGVESDEEKGTSFWFTLPAHDLEIYDGSHEILSTKNNSLITLTDETKTILKSHLVNLQQIKFYAISELEIELSQIDDSQNQEIKEWKFQLEQAINASNKERYNELINL